MYYLKDRILYSWDSNIGLRFIYFVFICCTFDFIYNHIILCHKAEKGSGLSLAARTELMLQN